MPFIRIDLPEGPAGFAEKAGDAVHRALVESLGIPEGDRFQVITEHRPGRLVADPGYLGVERSDRVALIEISLAVGRTVEKKKAVYRAIADRLVEVGLRREDVLICLHEVALENFSLGNGEAQYADVPPAHLAAQGPASGSDSGSDSDSEPAASASLPFRNAVPHGDFTFVSGQVGLDPATGDLAKGGVAVQFTQAVANLSAILEASGRSLSDIVRVGVYLSDMGDFAAMNDAYRKVFAEPYPARTTIGVAALPIGAAVEIDCVVAN